MSGRHHINEFDRSKQKAIYYEKDIARLLEYGWETTTIAAYLQVTKKRIDILRKKYKYFRRNYFDVDFSDS